MNKEMSLIQALVNGTRERKIKWLKFSMEHYSSLVESSETVEDTAYYFSEINQTLVVYKTSKIVTEDFGADVEHINIHLAAFEGFQFSEISFKVSDFDLKDESSEMWTLYKLAKRSENGADSLMDSIIKKYGK